MPRPPGPGPAGPPGIPKGGGGIPAHVSSGTENVPGEHAYQVQRQEAGVGSQQLQQAVAAWDWLDQRRRRMM